MKRFTGWAKRNWKRIILANLLGFAVQAAVIALMLWIGCTLLPATITAKAVSWLLFLIQMTFAK